MFSLSIQRIGQLWQFPAAREADPSTEQKPLPSAAAIAPDAG
jgi:hypothetical protein